MTPLQQTHMLRALENACKGDVFILLIRREKHTDILTNAKQQDTKKVADWVHSIAEQIEQRGKLMILPGG